MKNVEYLDNYMKSCGFTLSDSQLNQFMTFYEMLIEKNRVMNLTAITEFEDVVIKHFADSAALLSCTGEKLQGKRIIDVGTGAGFPGIPLKILLGEDVSVVLLDSLNKRVQFLNEVIQTLDLKNISAIHGRAEEIARKPEYREQFDYCVSRAVANLATLSEYTMGFVKVGGLFVSYKSISAEEEIKEAEHAITLLSGKLEASRKFVLPNTDLTRNLVCVRKVKPISNKYPRKAGLPGKEPLK